jgi:nucleoside-diphosphate-sugar epimerase
LITTCGTLALAKDELSTEDDVIDFNSPLTLRAQSEQVVDSLAKQGVRACVIRLPPTLHGEEDTRSFIDMMTVLASTQGQATYIGEGLNQWPTVHRQDASRLYRLALEKGVAGSRYHGVAEEGTAMKDIAEAIGQSLHLGTVSRTSEEAKDLGGILHLDMGIYNPTSG